MERLNAIRLYYFTSAKYGLQNIEKRRLKIARIQDLYDPFEFLPLNLETTAERKWLRKMKKLTDKEYGIVCFTDDWEQPMMWSHYAEIKRPPKHRLGAFFCETRI
jgi:hypothetical protein